MSNTETVRIAVHEAGHAVIALLFCPERIEEVTIVPGSFTTEPGGVLHAYLGQLTLKPLTAAQCESPDVLRAQLVTTLGGHVAEKVVLGTSVAEGLMSDLVAAGRLCEKLAANGPRATDFSDLVRLYLNGHPEVDDALICVTKMLLKERRMLDAVTQALLDRKTLTSYDLHRICLHTRRR